jgi:cyclohexyl-isocyanide hydratase
MKIVAAVYPGMTLLDLVGPMQTWSFLPGYEVQFVAGKPGLVQTDCGLGVHATHSFEDAWTDPDVLFVGGAGPPIAQALADERLIAFLTDRGARAHWVTSVCTGALLLGRAGLLRGYRAATYWACREQLAAFGAVPSDERVCIDRNRLTGGGITSGIDFGLRVAAHWAGEDTGRFLELMMEYAPEPPFGCGRPELAPPATLAAVRAVLKEAGLGG